MNMEISPLLCFVMVLCFSTLDALMFHLSPNQKKCLREEIHKDVLVTGDYELSDGPGQKTHLKVTDSKGHILYSKEDAKKGKFAFTTEEYDMFEVDRGQTEKSLAKAEKLKPLEVELRRLEDLSKSIVDDFAYMRAREEEMRDTNVDV
ncbi:hypothetical protein KUTeg_014339 [Tegillarca granosa]|uniref:GOLD domain-containing protein n=1 Tax=Tegillarca granosa TaxID=220873 RepID=A0ABQ9F1I7_TEGGR|nr:hypothetical protein KUTeg_014339 [Tegillarca granosa]